MAIIYLIRHGQACFGSENYDCLSNIGTQQAQVLNGYLQEILIRKPMIMSGDMQRHQQTAKLALGEQYFQTILINTVWNEFDHQSVFAQYDSRFLHAQEFKQDIKVMENPRLFLAEIFEGAIARWTSGEFDSEYPETWDTFKTRIHHALHDLSIQMQQENQAYAVVFTSGGVISVVAGLALGLSIQQIFELNWSIANASITKLKIDGQKIQLVSFNEHTYLKSKQANLLTWI